MTRQVINLARWEWFRQSRKISVMVLFSLVFLLAIAVLGAAVFQNLTEIPLPVKLSYFEMAAGFLSAVSPLLAIVLAALVHAGDLQGGNCRTLAARGASRTAILASKALLSSLVLLGVHLFVLAMAFALALGLAPHFQDWNGGLTGVAASYPKALLYLALGIALAHWRQSTSFTVGVGIAFIFFESIAYPLAGFLGELANWPIGHVTAWTLWGVTNGLEGNSELLDAGWFVPIVGAYTAALIGLAVWAFRSFDLRAGGE